ncbi:MAG: serine protease [Ruminococcaceae bacterium]|jgi:S1-C subfamily serine protease|nr:serine protease [Oscillospiraceae bacterium]
MPKECAACKQPASVLVRLHKGEKTIVVSLCQKCLIRLSKMTRVEILETIPQESENKPIPVSRKVSPVKRSKKPLLITVVALLILASIVGTIIFVVPLIKKAILKDSLENNSPTESVSDVPTTPEQIYEYASLATVEITAIGDDFISTGTGFFCDTSDYLITNYHVIEGTSEAYITIHDGGRYDITGFYGYDETKDIALLTTTYAPQTILKSCADDIKTGESVYVIGSSEGLTASFSSGIVASSERVFDDLSYIQITAPISHGNSGGPVLDSKGEVVGIASASFEEGQNLNLAIPICMVKETSKHVQSLLLEKKQRNRSISVHEFSETFNALVDHIKFYGERTDLSISERIWTSYKYEYKSDATNESISMIYYASNNQIRWTYYSGEYAVLLDFSIDMYPSFNVEIAFSSNASDYSHLIDSEQTFLFSDVKTTDNELHFEIQEIQGDSEMWLSGQKKLAYNRAFNKRLDDILSLFTEFCDDTSFSYDLYDFGFIQ